MGHVLMENRNGLLLQTFLSEASGRAERDVALLMAEALPAGKRVTLGGDKNYDTQEFIRELRGMNITPHVASIGDLASGRRADGFPALQARSRSQRQAPAAV
jgi:hypothetical protein